MLIKGVLDYIDDNIDDLMNDKYDTSIVFDEGDFETYALLSIIINGKNDSFLKLKINVSKEDIDEIIWDLREAKKNLFI